MSKDLLITLCIFLTIGIIVFVILVLKPISNVDENVVKCISNNSVLYTQTGCMACKNQLDVFGNEKDLLNIVDCTDSPVYCFDKGIKETPTWIINNKTYGKLSLNKLKELTGCQNSNIITGVIH